MGSHNQQTTVFVPRSSAAQRGPRAFRVLDGLSDTPELKRCGAHRTRLCARPCRGGGSRFGLGSRSGRTEPCATLDEAIVAEKGRTRSSCAPAGPMPRPAAGEHERSFCDGYSAHRPRSYHVRGRRGGLPTCAGPRPARADRIAMASQSPLCRARGPGSWPGRTACVDRPSWQRARPSRLRLPARRPRRRPCPLPYSGGRGAERRLHARAPAARRAGSGLRYIAAPARSVQRLPLLRLRTQGVEMDMTFNLIAGAGQRWPGTPEEVTSFIATLVPTDGSSKHGRVQSGARLLDRAPARRPLVPDGCTLLDSLGIEAAAGVRLLHAVHQLSSSTMRNCSAVRSRCCAGPDQHQA